MNIQEYISGGIVESYVLGLASEEERREFEQLCKQYPQLVAARDTFEELLERNAVANAVDPPGYLKEGVLRSVQELSLSQPSTIINMENTNSPAGKSRWSTYLAAASVILLLGCAYFIYQLTSQNKELRDSNSDLQAKVNTSDSILNKIVDEQKVIRDSNITVVNMVGTRVAPRSSANIYWDSTSTSVYLVVKNMPKLPTDQQYQLWALISGKPKDLGVFDATDDRVILKMKNTQKAEAFAITIEQKGGNPSPTLEKMQSMGKTNPL